MRFVRKTREDSVYIGRTESQLNAGIEHEDELAVDDCARQFPFQHDTR